MAGPVTKSGERLCFDPSALNMVSSSLLFSPPLGDNRMSFDCSLVEPTLQKSLRVLAFFNWRLKYRSIDRIFQAFVERGSEKSKR